MDYRSKEKQQIVLILSQVRLGSIKYMLDIKRDLVTAPDGCDSVKASGKSAPDTSCQMKDQYGAVFNYGPLVEQEFPTCTAKRQELQFNQYAVYRTGQVKVRYLVHVELESLPVKNPTV